jgi:hypothetical protein
VSRKISEKDDAAAASASINKTLKEVEAILNGADLGPAGELRSKLRDTLVKSFERVGRKWYRRGFNRGHREAYQAFSESRRVPDVLEAEKNRKIVDAGERRKIKLKSSIKNT